MSARYRRKKIKKKSKGISSYLKYILIFLVAAFLVFFLLRIKNVRYWSDDDKITVVAPTKSGDVFLYVADPVSEEIVRLIIPGELEVDVYGNLGRLRIGKVWELGVNEKLVGELLAKTVSSNFEIPVTTWMGPETPDLMNLNFIHLLQIHFLNTKTNMTRADLVKLVYFSKGLNSIDKIEIDLRDTNILKRTNLVDGEEGYILNTGLPGKIRSYFVSYYLLKNNKKLMIRDRTGKYGIAEKAARIIENMGSNIAVMSREEEKDLICIVKGEDQKLLQLINNVFSCEIEEGRAEGSFDAELIIGRGYVSIY